MADLQQRDVADLPDFFGGLLCVAGEENFAVAVGDKEADRAVVGLVRTAVRWPLVGDDGVQLDVSGVGNALDDAFVPGLAWRAASLRVLADVDKDATLVGERN